MVLKCAGVVAVRYPLFEQGIHQLSYGMGPKDTIERDEKQTQKF